MIGIKCDGCNKMHCADLRVHMYPDTMPDDWFTLYQGKPDRVEKTSQFCSLACLNRWLTPQLTKDAEVPVSSLSVEIQVDKEVLARAEECLGNLHTSICCLCPQEAATGPSGILSQMMIAENVKEDYKNLKEAIIALGKKEGN